MAGTPKWKGALGFARTATASATATPVHYPTFESAKFGGVPEYFERVTNQVPDIQTIVRAGFKYSFSITGLELTAYQFGYLMWLHLGADAYSAGHTLTPADAIQYANFAIDRGLDLDTITGGGQPTEQYVGCKIGRVTLEQTKDFAKVSIDGLACNLAAATAALTPSIPTGAANAPLNWAALQAGFVKLAYAGGAYAADTVIRRLKFESTRELVESGITLGSNQPDQINEGGRVVTFEVEREFAGVGAQTDYDAWKNNKTVGLEMKWIMGTSPQYSVDLTIDQAAVVDAVPSDIGVGAESIVSTLVGRAFKGTNPIMQAVVVDSTVAIYA